MLKFWIIVCIIFTIPTFYQLIRPGFFFMQDDLQAMRVHQMFKCFMDFQLPCRWVPDMGYQYGYPQFLYYPPSVYYLGAFLHLFGIQIIDSVKILFILGYIFSALFMFLFLRDFFNQESDKKGLIHSTLPALFGAMLYTYVPYKALEVYVRGALNEFWSLAIFPLVFWAIYKLIIWQKLKYAIFFAISAAMLMLTHNLMTLIFAPVAIVWCITLLILKKATRAIPMIILGSILAIGLSAFFTLPVIFEGKYVHLESLIGGYFDYRQHFVNVYRLFVSNQFGYGSSGIGHDNALTLSTGQIHWMIALLGFILSIAFFRKIKQLSVLVIIISVVEMMVLFLIHQKSSFIWETIPILAYLQFPWRFLAVSIFLLSFLGACAAFYIIEIKKSYGMALMLIAVAGILLLHANFYKPKEWFGISDKDKFSGPFWEKELTISIFDYLPIYAKLPPNKIAPPMPEILEGNANFLSYKKGSNFQQGQVQALEKSVIRLPLFDFPGMVVKVDNNVIQHYNNDCRGQEYCFGLITFKIDEGNHLIKAQLKDTPIRIIGNTASFVSLIILIILAVKYYRQ